MDRGEGFFGGTHRIVAQGRVLAPRVMILGLSVAILLMPVCTFLQSAQAAAQEPAPSPAIVTPDHLTWKPLIPGLELAVVSGDPDKQGGLYVIRIRAKGEVKGPPHWHVTDEHVTVLAGSFLLGHGDKYDASKLVELKVGTHSIIPAKMRHFGLHNAGSVIEVYGESPFVVNFVNPEDDPKNK